MHSISSSRLSIVLGMLMAIGPLAIDTYLPALPIIAETLGVGVGRVETSVALYLIGAAFGQLIGGQLSDRFGRHRVAYVGLLAFSLASLGLCLITELWQLYVLRLLQALGGGATVVIATASVRDFYSGREAAKVLTSIGLVMLVAPLLAPALGAMILHVSYWQGIFLALGLYALMMMGVLWKALPHVEKRHTASPGGILSAYGRVLKTRTAMGYILTNAFAFATMFVFITDSAFLYMEHFGTSSNLFPVLFGANVVLMIGFNRLNILLLKRMEGAYMLRAGLLVQLVSTLLFLILVLTNNLSLVATVPLMMFSAGSVALIAPNAISGFLSHFEADAGAATGISGALQFLLAGAAGTVVTALHSHSVFPMAGMMFGCSLMAMVLFASLVGWKPEKVAR